MQQLIMNLSLYKSKKSLSVCLSVCVWMCVCVPQISLRIKIRLNLRLTTWLLRGSMVCDFAFVWTAMKLLINYLINALQIREHCPLQCDPHLKKQADLYLQQHELDWDFAGGSVPFCSVHLHWLLWINETKQVRTEFVWVWGDSETHGQQSGIRICGCSCIASY